MIGPFVLAALIRGCAPDLPADLYAAQVAVVANESSSNAWVLHDNDSDACRVNAPCRRGTGGGGAAYYPTTFEAAVTAAATLVALDRREYGRKDAGVDIGLAQINSRNLPGNGVTIPDALHGCTNIGISARMLSQTYASEKAYLAPTPEPLRSTLALDRTLQTYNSGRPTGDTAYSLAVMAAMQSRFAQRTIAALYQTPTLAPIGASAGIAIARRPATRSRHASTPAPSTRFVGAVRTDAFHHSALSTTQFTGDH